MDPFIEFSVIILICTMIAIFMRLIKQPLIIAYIITGIIMGPVFFNRIHNPETIVIFSHFGVALLLFLVGLNLNPKIIKQVGKVSLITGVGQVVFTFIIGYLICVMLGFEPMSSAYIAIALTFSSTIIIMKLLSDKADTDKLYGRIAIGFLIVQDLIAILILIIISSFGAHLFALHPASMLFKGFFILLIVILIGSIIIPELTRIISKSQELLLLFSISFAFALSSLFLYLGFTLEIGALLAGILLSLSPYRYDIMSKLRPIRDFFIVLFFILLGSQMTLVDVGQFIIPMITLSLFVLIGNPLIVMILMGRLGYTKRNSFLAGLTVAQISEFSLIVVSLGVTMGHVNIAVLSLVTAVGPTTIAGSSYMIIYSEKLYSRLSRYLGIFEKPGVKVDANCSGNDRHEIILFGYNSIGHDLIISFKKSKRRFLVVDYNPDTIIHLTKEGVHCRYGDVTDTELLGDLSLEKAKMAISTINDVDANLLLIKKIREKNKKTIIILVSHDIDEAMELYESGATYIIMPHFLGGHQASNLIERHGMNFDKFMKEQISHLKHLRTKKLGGHEHPRHERP